MAAHHIRICIALRSYREILSYLLVGMEIFQSVCIAYVRGGVVTTLAWGRSIYLTLLVWPLAFFVGFAERLGRLRSWW